MLVIVLIVDILICSWSEDEYVEHLITVLQILNDRELYAKFSKCEFWLRSVAFLGHIFSGEGIQIDPKKSEAVKSWTRPLSPSYIQSFLGLVSYYRIFVEGFYFIVLALMALTQKKVKFLWSEAYEKTFRDLKDKLTSAPILTLSEESYDFVVFCDASLIGFGCVFCNMVNS
ncbi:hypothetical protein MTR67_035419 [Solanum verrucosum]|uniref:Reverse transcriptase/retrotransposon-derived protein RNase H-like domain-containing protein n=1 Tax=Solanum verrucosum TaxID=315347 RepID=A0AAF0ZMA5_SOLVR|nr:hypothetical protein MTR67_035419 [Solanum verrucosum]